jgi:toxin HigB-1
VIISFGDRATEDFYHGESSAKARKLLPPSLRLVAMRKLDMLNVAKVLEDLRSPPGNRLERLRGDLEGMHSIRINEQWRIIFVWNDPGPSQVSIVDYH